MATKFVINGVKDLKAALLQLPEDLTDEGGDIVRYNALNAAGRIRAGYPVGKTGNLRDGVVIETDNSGFGSRWGVRYTVVQKARHAYIYEYGTVARHYYTKKRGVEHLTGAMPAGNVFVPVMVDTRRRMENDLTWLLVRNGLAVKRAASGISSRPNDTIKSEMSSRTSSCTGKPGYSAR